MLKRLSYFFAVGLLTLSLQSFAHVADSEEVNVLPKTSQKQAYYIDLESLTPPTQNQNSNFKLSIKKRNGEIAKHKDFKVVHGRRLHLMSVNQDLKDYQHLHPRPEDLDGDAVYEFELTPTQAGTYQVYADLLSTENVDFILPATFFVPGEQMPPVVASNIVPGEIQQLAVADDLTFTMNTGGQGIVSGQDLMLNITVTKDGEAFRRLEPTMQAFAHLVGFSQDLSVMVHAHPMGEKLTSSSQRGGPNLVFHLVFPTFGPYRLFLQVKVDDKDIFVPIDVNVIR